MGDAADGMPRYRSHKTVRAHKIKGIEFELGGVDGAWITPAEPGFLRFHVDRAYVMKHKPQVGGYYVLYEDDYPSWSPAAPFEAGYTRIA